MSSIAVANIERSESDVDPSMVQTFGRTTALLKRSVCQYHWSSTDPPAVSPAKRVGDAAGGRWPVGRCGGKVRPSVCLSHLRVTLWRFEISKYALHYTIVQCFWLL